VAKLTTKFGIGDDVEHFTGIHGMVTAIFIRGNSRAYEMSYQSDGNPTSCTCEECELDKLKIKRIGFEKGM
jgi:hypothetical protein